VRPEDSKPARVVAVLCVAAFVSVLWPVYSWFGGIEPRVLGMPLSLTYLVAVIAAVFFMMLGLFLWEDRNDRLG
jgi:hypothetical protein